MGWLPGYFERAASGVHNLVRLNRSLDILSDVDVSLTNPDGLIGATNATLDVVQTCFFDEFENDHIPASWL